MINIHGHHGVHINFLTYALDVCIGDRDLLTTLPNQFADTYTRKNFYARVSIESVDQDKVIWVYPHNRLFFAYNLFTRAVQHILEGFYYEGDDTSVKEWYDTLPEYNFDNFTIHDWESYPAKYICGCSMISEHFHYIKSISKEDGTVDKHKMIWWYLKEILSHHRYYGDIKLSGKDLLKVPNTMFYDIEQFEHYMKAIQKQFNLTLDMTHIEKLYDQLQKTLSFGHNTVKTDGSYLSEAYLNSGKLKDIIYPPE
tara:strand:+ start:121 stop:882 length:762 start_codon:yes stop_codon:yes gene_type:complete